jgi:DNA-binding transcriptional LysR family regulator
MKLTHFRDLLAVVQTGSLRAASRHLGIAQPVITRSIRELEHELGTPLLERHSKGVALTPVGERFVRRIEAVRAEVRRAREEVDQWSGDYAGEVSIALTPMACMTLMPPALAAFNKRHPKAVTNITQSLFRPIENRLADGLLDFWIGPIDKESVSQRFSVECLLPHNRRIAARRDHPLSSAKSLSELANASWVRPSLDDRSAEGDLEAEFQRLGFPTPNVLVHSASMLVIILTVANTDLLTVLPEQIFEVMPIAQFCVPLEFIAPIPAAPICIVHRQGLPMTPLAENLSDLMRKAAHNYTRDTQLKQRSFGQVLPLKATKDANERA